MIVNLKSQTELSGFYIVFEGSTNLEERGIFGISHLMEHLICRNFQHLRNVFEREGIDWNAYTSQNEIVFYFTGLDDHLMNKREILIDLICEFKTTKEQFETEKKIILQEYKNHFSVQSKNHLSNLGRKLLNDFDAIGLRQDLESLRFIDCMNFFEKQFTSPTKIINVSNSNPFKLEMNFNQMNLSKIYEFGPYEDVILEPKRYFGDKVSLIMVSNLIDSDFSYISFINNMLSLGLSSPLYSEIREKKGLVYNIECRQSRMNKQSVNYITTETSQKNLENLKDSIKKILNNPQKYLNKKRFELVKDWYVIKFQKDKINRYGNVTSWINPKNWSVKDILHTVTYDKIMDVYERYYNIDNFYISDDGSELN